MILKTDPKLKMLADGQKIPKDAVCYGKTTSGKTMWCGPGSLVGRRWKKHSINHPSIVMVKNV